MKGVVIHHDDQDGRMGGYIMIKYLKSQGYDNVISMEADYKSKLDFSAIEGDDKVVIVDFSLDKGQMEDLQRHVDSSNIIWIDHHKSALEKYPEQANLDGIRFVGLAGCELAYIYSQGYRIKHDDKAVNINNSGDMEFTSIDRIEIPEPIRMIGDWDVWRQTPNSREVAFSLRADWPKSCLENPGGIEYWEAYMENPTVLHSHFVRGAAILSYVYGKGETDLKEYGYQVRIRKFEDLEAIAINSADRSSLVFESVLDKYEVGIVYNYTESIENGKVMTFSIYRLKKNADKDIDVSFIAKSFGGGGHHDAAGWTSTGALPFKLKI